MATLQKVIRVGSSMAAVLPKTFLKEAGISLGSRISLESVDDGVLIRPVRKITRRGASSTNEHVAETALSLIKRYQRALDRLAEGRDDTGVWETVVDFRNINPRGVPATDVLKALHRLHEQDRKVSRRA